MPCKSIRFAVFFGGILSASVLSGCGGPAKGSLSGKVTLDSKPLKGGRVEFVNQSGGQGAVGEIKEDGTYDIPLIYAGDYTVLVDTEYLNSSGPKGGGGGGGGASRPPWMKGGTGGPPAGVGPKTLPKDRSKDKDTQAHKREGPEFPMPGELAKRYTKLPEKYSKADSSGIKYTGKGGSDTFDIPLVSK